MNINQLLFIIILWSSGVVSSSWGGETPSTEVSPVQEPSAPQAYDFSVRFGNPETARLNIIMYHSLNCIHCKEYLENDFPQVKEKYIDTGKVYFEIRDFPIDQTALDAARLAWCRKDPKVYWEIANYLHNQLMSTDQELNWALSSDWCADLIKLLTSQGFNNEECHNCLNDEQLKKEIVAESFKVQQKYHLNYTPAFIVNDKLHDGILSLDDIKNALQKNENNSVATSTSQEQRTAG